MTGFRLRYSPMARIHIFTYSLMESYSEQLGIIIGDFGTDYPNTGQFGHLILSTMNLYSTW